MRKYKYIAIGILAAGLLLIGAGTLLFVAARDRQDREQRARERHWNKVQQEAYQRRILPGEERPAPAELESRFGIIGLVGAGVVVSIGGIVLLLKSQRNR
jgi:hypothetical protein